MKQIGVAIIGTGWCGGIRAQTCAAHPLVKSLDIAEVRPERLEEIARNSNARTVVTSASSAAFSAYVAAETQRWGKLAKESGATVD